MSKPLFLVDTLPPGDECVLDGPEGHHAADVARLRTGEGLLIGDGRGGLATAVVQAVTRGRVEVAIEDRECQPVPTPRLTVVQGIAKGDRGDLAVQAMTEVGVDAIVPWAAARSIVVWRDDKPLRRWRTVAREAAKQSRRAWIPEVFSPVRRPPRVDFVLHEEAVQPLSTAVLPDSAEIVLAVGPEGGVAPEELAAMVDGGAVPVKLGSSVLRTSTAGVAALAVLSARLGRW